MKFITIVYPPMDSCGASPASPASESTKGSEEITLLPRADFTQRATPRVIRFNDARSSRCCQINDAVFSVLVDVEDKVLIVCTLIYYYLILCKINKFRRIKQPSLSVKGLRESVAIARFD